MTVMPLGWDQDCSLKIREPEVPAPWFLDPGGWSKTAAVSLYFIFPGICTLSLKQCNCPPDAPDTKLFPTTTDCSPSDSKKLQAFLASRSVSKGHGYNEPFQYGIDFHFCVTNLAFKNSTYIEKNQNRVFTTLVRNYKVTMSSVMPNDDSKICSGLSACQAKMGRRQCKSAYNTIKNKTTPESSPPPTPKSDHCNADKAEENDLKKPHEDA
ncbi:hypothetical protein STEG23_000923 [Scotinomys teguina]